MAHYRRCWGCPASSGIKAYRCPASNGIKAYLWPCEVKEEWRRKIAGLGLTSVLFRCAKFADHYRPGMCVNLRLQGEFGRVEFGGVIMRWSKVPGKLLVWLDTEYRMEHQCIKVYAKDVTLTGETVKLCGECGVPVTAANVSPTWYCDECCRAGRIEDGMLMREIAEGKA